MVLVLNQSEQIMHLVLYNTLGLLFQRYDREMYILINDTQCLTRKKRYLTASNIMLQLKARFYSTLQ